MTVLDRLIARTAGAGVRVDVTRYGQPRDLPASIDLSAYRIIQEALTNALKYALGGRARVRLAYEPRALEIEVTDQGGAGSHDLGDAGSGGRGVIGMRERVALYGGEFEAGPTPTGFRVHARLPLDPGPVARI